MGISRNVLRGSLPCGNRELTSHLHKFRWYIIIKESRGEYVHLRMTVFRRSGCYCWVWPWVRLGLSFRGIPASQVYPEQKAKMTQRSVRPHHRTQTINCTSPAKGAVCESAVPREAVAQNKPATDAKTKTPPLGNLMIHKTKKRLQHQRLLITYKSHQVIIVCLQSSLVSYASGRCQTGVNHHKNSVSLEQSSLLCNREWLQTNTGIVIVNFCLYRGAVQSHPICLCKIPGSARRAF